MYKALFYHKQDIFVWGILGLYHIRLIEVIQRRKFHLKIETIYDKINKKQCRKIKRRM